MTIVDTITQLFVVGGKAAYFGEAVSQIEHALQTAHLAETAGANEELIVASLLHDVGHLLHDLPEDFGDRGLDDHHENSGAAWLERSFGPAVAAPVRLHVAAKRYLCAIDPQYLAQLSPTSQQSLRLQGGPFSDVEARQFESQPHAEAAIALRRWDDKAKVSGLVVPEWLHYLPHLKAVLQRRETSHDSAL